MARPWIGSDFRAESNAVGGLRLMILGESMWHPTKPIGTDEPDMNEWLIESVLSGKKYGFYNKLSRLMANGGQTWLTQAESVAFWQSVAFYNYVPTVASNRAKQRPPTALWVGEAPRLFLDVVRDLRPEAILVCGFELWGHLPEGLPTSRRYRAKGKEWPVKEYDTGAGYPAVGVPIPHPSGYGWSYGECLPRLDRLFANVASVRASHGRESPSLLALGRP